MSLNLDYVYPAKGRELERLYNEYKRISSGKTYKFNCATVFPVVNYNDNDVFHGRGGVLDKDGNYIEESKTKGRVEGKYPVKKEECIKMNKKVVYCGYFFKQWGHYITEVVSRLWYALEKDETIDYYVFIAKKGESPVFSGNYLNFLKLLGIEDKILVVNEPTVFDQVVIPEDGFVYGEYYTSCFSEMYDYINQKALALYDGPKYEKVYFSKSLLPGNIRFNLNFKIVDEFFQKNGFQTLYPEKLTLIETIGVLQNAKYFATVTSSPAHNLLFSNKNQTMISIEKQAFLNPYQTFIAKINGAQVVFIDAFKFIFPIETSGPFFFDYTKFWEKYANDNNMYHCKPMSNHKFKKNYKRYMSFYFSANYNMPPDYLFEKYNLDVMREAYNDTVHNNKALMPGFYDKAKVRLKDFITKHFKIVVQ